MKRKELDEKIIKVIEFVRPTANYPQKLFIKDGKLGTKESLGGGIESGLLAFPVMEGDFVRFTVIDETADFVLKDVLVPNPNEVTDFYEALITHVAKNPNDASKIPAVVYKGRKTLGEEILTVYQEIKMAENQEMEDDDDRTEFFEGIKTDVKVMNHAFNEAEKDNQHNETKIAHLCARNFEV